MPTISPLVKRTVTDDAAYQKNFHDGHRVGHADAKVGKFAQFSAANNPQLPGYGDGYRAGHRLAEIERTRK
jgi:hypothetical protein